MVAGLQVLSDVGKCAQVLWVLGCTRNVTDLVLCNDVLDREGQHEWGLVTRVHSAFFHFLKIFISFHQHWDNNAVRKCYKIKKTKRLKERHWLPAITSATTTRPCWASTFQSLFLLMSTKCQSDLLPIRKYKHKLIWHKLASMIFTITEREEAWCLTASLSCTH